MSIPQSDAPHLTAISMPLIEYVQEYRLKDDIKRTEFGQIPNRVQFSLKTESATPKIDNENKEQYGYKPLDTPVNESNYTTDYLALNTRGLINNIENELELWIQKGTTESHIHILNIKQSLEKYETYLIKKSETRLLLSSLELIFKNNAWESLPVEKLKFLKTGIQRFSNGEVENRDLVIFLTEMHKGRISPLTTTKHEKETQSA